MTERIKSLGDLSKNKICAVARSRLHSCFTSFIRRNKDSGLLVRLTPDQVNFLRREAEEDIIEHGELIAWEERLLEQGGTME